MNKKGKINGKAEGEETHETKVAAVLNSKLRLSDVRGELRSKTRATDEELEKLLNSPSLQRRVRAVMAAYIQEQLPDLVVFLVGQAREKQAWAWKVLLEVTGLSEVLRAAVLSQPDTETSALVSSAFERDMLGNIRELLSPVDAFTKGAHDQGEPLV